MDCFYVYHTVNNSPEAGNTETLVPHPENVIAAVFRNGAHYRGVCRMFAPLYHQMSLITYSEFTWQWQETEFFQTAYDDVVEAFEYYLRNHNNGRGIVFIGHSQGSHVLTKLLQDKFENNEVLREQLISAVLMGHTNVVQVPDGETAGGTFENIPLCASTSETGCVIGFDAIAVGVPGRPSFAGAPMPPMERACVNPALFGGGPETLAALIYPRTYQTLIPFPDEVETEWVRYPDIYESRCTEEGNLEVDLAEDYAGEAPITPQGLQQALVEVWGVSPTNLHAGEYFIANTDLVPIVEQQIDTWSGN